jgi:hypothetical protein
MTNLETNLETVIQDLNELVHTDENFFQTHQFDELIDCVDESKGCAFTDCQLCDKAHSSNTWAMVVFVDDEYYQLEYSWYDNSWHSEVLGQYSNFIINTHIDNALVIEYGTRNEWRQNGGQMFEEWFKNCDPPREDYEQFVEECLDLFPKALGDDIVKHERIKL